MKRTAALLLALVLAVGGCEEEDDLTSANNPCRSLTGTYTATAFTATGTGNSSLSNNFLGNGGSFTIAFTETGNFTTSYFATQGATAFTRTGIFTNTGSSTLTLGGQALVTGMQPTVAQSFTCSVSGSTLTLVWENTTFVFPGSTDPQPARVNLTLTKTS